MDAQKEALRRIILTLTNKNQDLKDYIQDLNQTQDQLQEESCRVMSELEAELEKLSSALEERGAELRADIIQSQQRKEAELQAQQGEGLSALAASEELLTMASSALDISDDAHFQQAAREIRERVTMATAFRLSPRPLRAHMSHFAVDFSTERAGLQVLNFLPVPPAPLLDMSRCFVRDNSLFVQWSSINQSGATYELQYRKCDREAPPPAAEAHWETVRDIRDTSRTVPGLRFDSRFLQLRVRAWNKASAGDYSDTLLLQPEAFHFSLDSASAHPDLSVESYSATWKPTPREPRVKSRDKTSGRSSTLSPVKSLRVSRERFAGESYTVLGDQEISGGGHYWEVRPMGDWKVVSVGVAYRSALSRFVQMGKSPASWSLSISQWLQPSVSAKHNNKNKSLESNVPVCIGVYCHHGNGDLLFLDVDQTRLIHSFRTRFKQPLVPAFSVWCGGVAVETGLQVPNVISHFLPLAPPPDQALPPEQAPPPGQAPPPDSPITPPDQSPDSD